MKRFLVVVISGLFLLSNGLIQSTFAAEEAVKIGVVDLLKALNESEVGKKAKGDLEAMIKLKQLSIDEKGKKIEQLKADLDKQASIISAEAKKSREEDIERLIRDYQRIVTDSQAEVKKKEGELTNNILKELREVIEKIGQEEDYTIILEQAEGLVLYSNKANSITEKTIKRYNELKSGKK